MQILQIAVTDLQQKSKILEQQRDDAYKAEIKAEDHIEWYWYALGGVAAGIAVRSLIK